jgi:hypothetical protein
MLESSGMAPNHAAPCTCDAVFVGFAGRRIRSSSGPFLRFADRQTTSETYGMGSSS